MRLPPFLALLGLASTAPAAVYTYTDTSTTVIPDGDSSGVSRPLIASTGGQVITNVEVGLSISATTGGTAFLGDLYIYLTNGTSLAVLANRPGRTALASAGYSDNQHLSVLFSVLGAGDFHDYRVFTTGSNLVALTQPLTGTWQADGRFTDPGSVLDTSDRNAGLGVFNNSVADGTWRLYAADLSSGGTHQINSWTLNITAIPEPSTFTLAGTLLTLALRRRR